RFFDALHWRAFDRMSPRCARLDGSPQASGFTAWSADSKTRGWSSGSRELRKDELHVQNHSRPRPTVKTATTTDERLITHIIAFCSAVAWRTSSVSLSSFALRAASPAARLSLA